MKIPARAICSSTHFALVVICLWTSWKLMTTLLYVRVEQSPYSCFLWGCAMQFPCALVLESPQPLADIVQKVDNFIHIVWE